MKREIRWSKTARQSYLDILLYIQDNWGDERAIKFSRKVESILASVKNTPFMFPATSIGPNKKIRRCVVSKQSSLYYKVEEKTIDLLTFYDNRRDLLELEFDD